MASVEELEKLGAVIKPISLPNMQHAIPAYYVIAPAEASSNLSRFDGVRFGYRCENPENLIDLYKRSRGERSEEHTSELQSLMRISYAVFCLKKKKKKTSIHRH